MPLVDVEQGTSEWLQMRIGCVTAARVADVMAKLKNGGEAAGRRNYKSEIVCEMLTGRAIEHYVTPAMEWGIENEIFARNAYEVVVGETERAGFALHEKITRFGASPDGFAGVDGLVEFKCPTTATHLDYIAAGVVPAEYHWQMLAGMACTERRWCDFVSYDPRLPKKFQLFIRRFERDEARICEMENEVEKFLWECVEQVQKMEKSKFVDISSTEGKLQESCERVSAGKSNESRE
jgi:putative phage-type endonuclease